MLIVFVGLPGSGKSSIVREMASLLKTKNFFVEPGEKEWSDVAKDWKTYGNFSMITWFRSIRVPMLTKAKKISQTGKLALVDSYYDKILHYYVGKPGMEWLISPSDPYFNAISEVARLDKDNLPDADLIIFLKISYCDWIEFLKTRNREMDNYDDFLESFNTQDFFLEASKELCKEKKIELIVFQQTKSSARESALRLINLLKEEKLFDSSLLPTHSEWKTWASNLINSANSLINECATKEKCLFCLLWEKWWTKRKQEESLQINDGKDEVLVINFKGGDASDFEINNQNQQEQFQFHQEIPHK